MNFKNGNTQINITIPGEWKAQLENIARLRSAEEGRNITFLDLMREAIQEKFQLEDPHHGRQ
jgi:hypothetical protein